MAVESWPVSWFFCKLLSRQGVRLGRYHITAAVLALYSNRG
jgi:hypothetical protein